jgi:putative glutamine amidotransferase
MAGGLPVILPMTQEKLVLEGIYQLLDGLLLPGGQDINPQLYGEEPHRMLETVDPLRDITEMYLTQRALADDMPIFAVCRGAQVLNVAAGGTLYQDIHSQLSADCLRHFQDYSVEWPSHGIQVGAGTRLREIIGEEKVLVNSYHHQAVKDLAPGFVITARASDGVVEGIESSHHTYVVGVQWHPELLFQERDFNLALFRSHVEAAGRFAAERTRA